MDIAGADVDRLVRRIVEIVHPLRIVLFGSRARGDARPDSDVDLLVVMPDGTHRNRTSQRLYRDIADAGVAFDRNTPGYVYGTILREGRDVYTR